MRAWLLKIGVFAVMVASLALAQVGNGTITGTVTDPAGAVVPGATVEAKNAETGVVFPAVSTNTGAYTIPELPIGNYVVTVKRMGFQNLYTLQSRNRSYTDPPRRCDAGGRIGKRIDHRHRRSFAA